MSTIATSTISQQQPLVSAILLLSTTTPKSEELALRKVADLVGEGLPLDDALHRLFPKSPRPITLRSVAALQVVARSNSPSAAMARWLASRSRGERAWMQFRSAMSYSIGLSLGTLVPILLLQWGWGIWVYRPLLDSFEDSIGSLPAEVISTGAWMTTGAPLVLALIVAILVVLALCRLFAGARAWSRLRRALPVVGSMDQWTSAAWWLRDLAIATETGRTLPDAIQQISALGHDVLIVDASQKLVAKVQAGGTLADSVAGQSEIPNSIVPLLRLGEQRGTLPLQLVAAAEILEARVEAWADFLSTAIPPIVLIFAGALTLSMFAQMFSLIRAAASGMSGLF